MSSHPRRRSTDTISKGNSLQFVSCPVFTLDKPKQTWYGIINRILSKKVGLGGEG